MRIGILSDTHNNLPNLRSALARLRRENVDTLFHLGDITRPETARELGGFWVIHLVGNGDYLSGEIRRVLLELNPENYSGMVYTGQIGGAAFAATHGHLAGKVDALVASGRYDYVLHGHSHRRKDQAHGATRILNPGGLGGLKPQERSFILLDPERNEVAFVPV